MGNKWNTIEEYRAWLHNQPKADLEEPDREQKEANEKPTMSEIMDDLKEIAASFRESFRHNKTFPELQERREKRVEQMENCIRDLEGNLAEANTITVDFVCNACETPKGIKMGSKGTLVYSTKSELPPCACGESAYKLIIKVGESA